ncbi:cytochrome c oxidase subunit 5B, mitochondrial [Eurytemora carolleeae]|uniref:cytochrome c oxidase subunit 5B, mitochondrial n=1 Tax=Eurytemora carolleeae TaxID=1294199 RepID=UPI000C791A15|nr:cytochrome c oxidase subunit 5B, mitochondrial [Eurytemora carolleeae]|eukprot:XP_023326411.1 cytochrome c oxidase subunit 5B, mitochondrial-like [Eurytemora affinis]
MSRVVSKSLSLLQSGRRSLHVSAVSAAKQTMPDPIEHATGLEKYELLAKQAGNDDPFFLKACARGPGTKAEPTIVNAMDTYRSVGCVCNEEDTNIKWMWLCEGAPKRCACGYWFELKVHAAPDKYSLPL